MKIYNFLFDPELNSLRLNMDASLVDPLVKSERIDLFDREKILNLGKSVSSSSFIAHKNKTMSQLDKNSASYSRDKDAPKILHPMAIYSPEEFLKSHKLLKAKLEKNLEEKNLEEKNLSHLHVEKDKNNKISKNQMIIKKLKNS
tara:strand:+ start:202 stop:633 length:432 start_codon:yes stop_codon:yes gene_type:complete